MDTLHPALVHFPIALVCALAVAELGRFFLNRPGIETVRFLSWFTLVGIIAAYWSGHEEFEALGVIADPVVMGALGAHENTARAALWVFPIAVLLLELAVRAPLARWPIWGFRLLLTITLTLVAITGLRGGELVYTHGLGVATAGGPHAQP